MSLGCTIMSPRRSVPPCSGNIPHLQCTRSLKWHHQLGKSCSRCSGIAKMLLLTEFQQRDNTVTSASYWRILTKLRATIHRKQLGVLTKGVLLLHDNARPHNANHTTTTLMSFKWEVLQHPPYSPDLALSNFHLFGPLKQHLSGERFPDDALERTVCSWFRQ